MIWFFYGIDTLTPREKIAALIAKYEKKNTGATGLTRLDFADGATVRDVATALGGVSLFTPRKLTIVRNPFAVPAAEQREFAALLEGVQSDDVLVVWEQGSVRQTAVLYKALAKHGDTVKEFSVPRGQEYLTWIARRADQLVPGTTIARDAADMLAARIGNDLIRMHSVLMQCVAHADGGRVTREVVEQFVGARAEVDAFRAVEAVTGGNKAHALTLLREQFAAGEDAFRLFGLYVYQVRALLSVAECLDAGVSDRAGIARATDLKPFVITKMLGAAKNVSLPRVRNLHSFLTELDVRVKRGDLTMHDALYEFVARA